MNEVCIAHDYDEVWARLIKAPKDGTYIPVIGSDRVDKHTRFKLSRAMRARCERQDLPYRLHAVKTNQLQFWWEERHVGQHLSTVIRTMHEMDKERFDLAVESGIHPALNK